MNQPKIDLSPKGVGRDPQDDLLHVRLPLRHQRAHEKGPSGRSESGLHRGQPRPPCEQRGAVRQRLRWHHAGQRALALRAPLKRVGPRGSGEFEEISWDEALQIAADWLEPIRKTTRSKLAFFTGRDQSQSFTSFWAQNFGTPNYAAHGGFCSVNMAAAGIYTMGGAFWEFGQPDWDHTKLFMLFGVAEDHDSQPDQNGHRQDQGTRRPCIGVNPIRTGYNAVLTIGSASRRAPTACSSCRWCTA